MVHYEAELCAPHLESAAESLVVIIIGRVGVSEPPHGRPRRRLHQATVAPRDSHLWTPTIKWRRAV